MRAAADTITERAPHLTAGTIYALSWPSVRKYAPRVYRRDGRVADYNKRRIRHEYDPALDDYEEQAGGRRQRTELDAQAEALHAWDGSGPPPFDLKQANAVGPLRHLLPLARWVRSGARMDAFDVLFVDEAQDMGALELAATMMLLRPGGALVCYGDPGQALFASAKGLREAQLPPVWRIPGAVHRLKLGGFRVGDPAASAAARVLRPLWDRPAAAFAAPSPTPVLPWHASGPPPKRGLVLGYSRKTVRRWCVKQALRDFAVTPATGKPDGLTVCVGHAAKGAEADDVYLLPWSRIALERLDRGEAGAVRLLYVMITRARRRLFVHDSLLARIGE